MSEPGEIARSPETAAPEGEVAETGTVAPAAAPAAARPGAGHVQRRGVPRTTRDTDWAAGSGIEPASAPPPDDDPSAIHAAAGDGTATAGGPLPHRTQLEGAFGLDLSSIIAHTGPDAQASADAMGASGYATGNHVVVPSGAGVGLVAHEVTHVLQQQEGVHLSGGVDGGASDPLEREADSVGAAVERGESVAGRFSAPGSGGKSAHVQRDTRGKEPAKEKPLTDAEKTDLLNRARTDRAIAGISLLGKRWAEKMPALTGPPSEPLDLPIGQFKQDAYNLLVVDRIDLSPVISVLDAPGRENHSRAINDVLQALERDLPLFAPIKEDITSIVEGGPIQRVRTRLVSNHAMLSTLGKRALFQVGPLGFEALNTYFYTNGALDHGTTEDKRLGLPPSYKPEGSWQATVDGRGIVGRPGQVMALVQMIRSGNTPIDEKAEAGAPAAEAPAAIDPEIQKKVDTLKAAIETAIATAEKAAAEGKSRVLQPADVVALNGAIQAAGDKAQEIVFADPTLMAHLAQALDRTQAKDFFDKLDPIERLYKICESKRAADEDPNTQYAVRQTAAWEGTQNARERYKLIGKGVFGAIRQFLVDHAAPQYAALRLRIQDHTKLKDDFIDRLPEADQRKIYRLIHRGTEDPTPEDKVHEAAAAKDGAGLIAALRELAGSDPVRLKDLEKDMVFRTAALSLTEAVRTSDGLYLRPDQFCLRLWGIDAGDVESTDPGTLKLTEVDPTGDNKPLTMDERLTLEENLFGPCIQELNDEITGKNDKKTTTKRGDDEMQRDVTRHMVVNRPGDPQAVSNILVNYDRVAAQPDMVALLRREHVVFGREIERRYLERYGVELRQWIYDNSGPVNRSGANRVLGNEQGGAVGMFNGKMLMAGEMDQAGKMTLAQALREHIYPPGPSGRPIYEWASVSSRVIASELGNKQKLLDEWHRFKEAVDATAAEIKTATGINVRAIDLLRNAYMEHTGHFQTSLEAKYKNKPDDLAAIKADLGLTADVDTPPDAPPPSVEEVGHKMYKEQASMLWTALSTLGPKSTMQWYSFAGTAMKFRFLPRIPNDPGKQEAPRPAEGQEGYTIEEVPPRSFTQYYRMQYGAFPDFHAAAQLRAMGDERVVAVEDACRALGIDSKLVTGEWKAPQERPSIGPHNRHLVRADFDMDKAKETAAEIWNVLLKDSRFDTIQDLLGRFIEEEQRLIRAEFRQLSGGIDLTFYIRQAIDQRERERVRRTERQQKWNSSVDYALLQGNWEYEVKVGTEGTSEGKAALKDPGDHTIKSTASDAQLEQMLAISMSGNLDVRTRLRAACKRDAWSEIKQIVDELTVDERKLVLQDGPLMNEIYSHLEQYDDERVYKVLTGQGDLADRLYSRSHGGSWSERHIWGGTDEAGMRQDIKNYLRQLRLKYNAEIRAQAKQQHDRNPDSPPIDPAVIDREVNRRVVADGMKLASDSKVRAIFESELDKDEKAEMTAMLQNAAGEARDWAVAGGAGRNDILSDIRQMKPDERLRRLNDPNYMQLLGERLKDEKDYRDAVNALKEGTSGGNDGLSKLDEHSRSGAQTDGAERDKEETLKSLMSLSPTEFEALQKDPRLQLQVLSALDEEGQAVARAYLAGPGSMPLAIETAGKVQDEVWGGGDIAKRDAASGASAPGTRTETTLEELKPGEKVEADPAAEKVDPAAAQKAAEDKLIAERKDKYVRFMVHQAIHKLMGACRTRAGWQIVLEEAVDIYKLDLPVPGHLEGREDMTSPRRVIWDAVAPSVAGFGVYHDNAPFQMTKQHIDGAGMKTIVRAAVLGTTDPSDDLIAESIVTVDEQVAEEEYKKKQNNGVSTVPFVIKKDHQVAEDDLKSAVSSASDEHVIKAWSTYLAPPPGGSNANTMKARYDEYRQAFKAALPSLNARYRPPPKDPPKPSKKPAAPTQVAVGGKDMEGAIDTAGDKAVAEAEPTPRAPLGPLDGNEKDPLIAQMMLTRAKFIQFQVGESADFESLLRPYMGDDRQTTAAGSYNPSANKLSVTKNKRYNNLVEALLSRVAQIQTGSVVSALQMDKDDRWLLETGLRDESAQMAMSMQKNLRYSGLQRDVGSTALAEKETLDVTTFLLNHTFADASADYQIDSQEKDTLAYRRSENDRARDSYKAALETAAMWASLITSVLLTIAATILTGGLALGPLGAMAIGGVTMLLSAHAQAAVNKDILQDEFDSKDKADLVAREVMTGLVTMGTTFFAQGILSVAGKGMRLAQQAVGIKAVLGRPPSLWQMFLREASEEVTSELADTYVSANLEATNPEHWVHGYKIGAKKSAAAADAILKTAPDRAFSAAITSIVTAGVGKLRGRGGHGHEPEFEVPSAGRKRQVNLRKNLKQAFGDPEEKFTQAGLEWLMQQAQNGSIDWDNAPADFLQGLLQEYKEVGHEAHIASANAGMRARKVDRHLARHGHLLSSEAEVREYKKLTDGADDASPFVTVQDYARIRTEVAVAGLQAHEAQNGPLTTLQRDEFVKWVREADGNDDLQERARRDPMSIDRVKYADANAGANTAVGKPIASAEVAARVMRDLADGNLGSLHELGIQVPPGFDPTKNEWGLGRRIESNGKTSYILIRGEGSAVNWEGFPGVEPIAHSHPDKGPDGRQSNHLKNLDASGGVSLVSLVTTDGPNRIHFLPSGADLVFCLRHGIQEHTVFTPFQSLGNGMVGNPKPGANNAGINIIIKRPSLYGYMLGNRESPVAQVEIEIWAAGGSGPLHTMTLYGSDHLGGSWLYHNPPGPPEVELAQAGGAAAGGPQRTPAGQHDGGGPVPADIHDAQDDHPSQRPTQVIPTQTDPSQRPTQVIPAETDPSHRPTQVIPTQPDPHHQHQEVDPSQRPTGQHTAVDPSQIQGPPSMPDVAQPTPTGNRPARPAPEQRAINRTALTVFDEVPQLAEIESVQGEAMVSGGHVMRRAQHAMQAMSDHDYQGFKALVQSHQSAVARAFLFKAIASGNNMSDVYWLSDQISGQDDAWMIDHLTLGDPRAVGGGIQQQWSTSCNAAVTLMMRGNYDPVFALKFRQANAADPMGTNAHQAQLEQQMLESQYGGNWQNVPQAGHAVAWDMPGGIGRAADDLLNKHSTFTGLDFTPHVPASQSDAVAVIDNRLRDGMQVPVILGGDGKTFAHYVLAMQRREGPNGVEFQLHDPGGQTRWFSAADITAGRADLFGYSKIDGLDVPSDIDSPANAQQVEAGGAPGAHHDDQNQRNQQNQQQNQQDAQQQGEQAEKKGKGNPIYALRLSDVIRDMMVDTNPKETGSFEMHLRYKLPNGRDGLLATGGCKVDKQTGKPTSHPDFYFQAEFEMGNVAYTAKLYDDVQAGEGGMPVGVGESTPLTRFALSEYIALYKKQFGAEPDAIGGGLAFDNKKYFQQEFWKNKHEKGMSTDAAAVAAVASISFGTHRAALGYGDFEVLLGDFEEVDLGVDKQGRKLGTHKVPAKIDVVARKSAPAAQHPGPGGPLDWIKNVFRGGTENTEEQPGTQQTTQTGPVQVGPQAGPVQGPPAPTRMQTLASDLGQLLRRDPDEFVKRYRNEMAELDDHELAELNRLLRETRVPPHHDEARMPPAKLIELHKKRLTALKEIGAFDEESFHGSRSEMLEGLAATGGEIVPAAELERRGLTMQTGEGNKFTPNAAPKDFVSIGQGEAGFGTSMAYADMSQQLAHYNVKLMSYEDLQARVTRLDFIVANFDSIDVQIGGPFAMMVVKQKAHFVEEQGKLQTELTRRNGLPPNSPGRRGGPGTADNYPVLFEFDLAGSGVRVERRSDTKAGEALHGEASAYGPIDLKTSLRRVYAPAAKLAEVHAKLTAILGHDNFELIAMEAVGELPNPGMIGQTRAATFNGLAAQEKEFEYAERAYERAAREGKPLDMTLYFEERSRQ
jgi:hypothetical protein